MDSIEKFSIFFYEDKLIAGSRLYSLGEITTEYLNMDHSIFQKLETLAKAFIEPAKEIIRRKDIVSVSVVQEKLNCFLDLFWSLPPYRDLSMEQDSGYRFFQLLAEQEQYWSEVDKLGSQTHESLKLWLSNMENLAFDLEWFVNQTGIIVYRYLEPLLKRTKEAYAFAFGKYCRDRDGFSPLLPNPGEGGTISEIAISFEPIRDNENPGRAMMGEVLRFNDLVSFIKTDFYRGLMHGNAPRKCQNCGKYFLLTNGYNTCYCNNIAPGETERTCRKVGAHNKEAKKKTSETPAQQEYRKAYNRLKMRKARGKISIEEWNQKVVQAQKIKDQAERGELSDEEMRR